MKNITIKIMSLLLILVMMMAVLASCSGSNTPATGTSTNGEGTSTSDESSSAATENGSTETTSGDASGSSDVTTQTEITTEVAEVTTQAAGDNEKIPKDKKIRILFIGNSLTYYNDMPEILEKLAKLDGREIEVEAATQGSGTMQEQISTTTGIGQEVRQYLKQSWDYVVLQPSRRITEKENTVKTAEFEAGKTLDTWIKNAGAKTLIYCTWGNNTGTSKIYAMKTGSIESSVTGEFEITQDAHSAWMQTVCKEYCTLLGAEMVDCAELFRYMINNQKAYNVYYTDNRHPSLYGSFAVACAFYAHIFGKSPVDVAKKYVGITPAGTAEILAASASHVILGDAAPEQHMTAAGTQEKTYNLNTAEWKGSGTEADPYIVSTAEEFNWFALKSETDSFKGKYIKQTADISFGGSEIRPVGAKLAFEGKYDGQNHTLSYFSITLDAVAGLFCKISGAEVKNVKISCATVLGAISGTVVGFAARTSLIENCFVDGGSSSTGSTEAGGIAGVISATTIKGCRNEAPVIGSCVAEALYCGGICGIAGGSSLITSCVNTGDVTSYQSLKGKNGCSGGILGCQGIAAASMDGEVNGICNVEKCVNYGTSACTYDGDVESRPYCGGIIGRGSHYNGAAYIKECFNFGTLINTGKNKYYGSGQICGVYVYTTITIQNCYGLDTVGTEFTAIHGTDAQGSGYLVGKFGQKFSTSQYIKPSATIAALSRTELEAKMKEIIK